MYLENKMSTAAFDLNNCEHFREMQFNAWTYNNPWCLPDLFPLMLQYSAYRNPGTGPWGHSEQSVSFTWWYLGFPQEVPQSMWAAKSSKSWS